MGFEVYRSRHNDTHFVAILTSSNSDNADAIRGSQNLEVAFQIPEDANASLGFDPAKARAAIDEHGFYAFAVHIEPRDNHNA
jgi:hypothetical protein